MKPYFFVGLLFVACVAFQEGPYSFEDGWKYVQKLDRKHGTEFRKERFNQDFLALEKIDPYLKDLGAFKARLEKDPDSLDKKKLLWLIDARERMLESQRFYQLALQMGELNWEHSDCNKLAEMEYAFKYYKAAREEGNLASRRLDWVLQDFEVAQKLIGVNENSPAFYRSDWDGTNLLLDKIAFALNNCAGY